MTRPVSARRVPPDSGVPVASTDRERRRAIDTRSAPDSGARTLASVRTPARARPDATTLRYQRCSWCSAPLPAGRLLCTTCGAADLTEAHSAGYGTAVRLIPHSRRTGAPAQDCLVALDEGFTLWAWVSEPHGVVRLGSRVRLVGIEPEAGTRFLARPVERRSAATPN